MNAIGLTTVESSLDFTNFRCLGTHSGGEINGKFNAGIELPVEFLSQPIPRRFTRLGVTALFDQRKKKGDDGPMY